jgi:anti-anti-sigma regulatory factor/pSer/pThr/pTyr-binding forkhead associated (FHA) protein
MEDSLELEGIPLEVGSRVTSSPLTISRVPAAADDMRMENWIASNLDLPCDPEEANHWYQLIENLPRFRPTTRRGAGDADTRAAGGWRRFALVYRRGITVVRMLDKVLVQQTQLAELDEDLMDLVAAGNHRIVMNFTAVERLGSWILGAVGNLHRRCAEADGGQLRICGLDPQLAEIFSIVGMSGELSFHENETDAIESPWPEASSRRELPIELLTALRDAGAVPPIRGGEPTGEVESEAVPSLGPGAVPSTPASQAASNVRYSLMVELGSAGSRRVNVSSPSLVIGRDRGCKLRLGSAQVSKRHAVIEQREGRLFLRDLLSTNGTSVNGAPIRDQERELLHGDRIQIGPASLVVSTGDPPAGADDVGHQVLDPLPPEPDAGEGDDDRLPSPPTDEIPLPDASDDEHPIRHEVIENVLVVTPQMAELSGEAVLEALRSRLQLLNDARLPRRLVINLEFVQHLSRQAIAILLAHHVRLEWSGGALRICQAHARIVAMLDQVRLTMLIDCYPTLDEAVIAAWSNEPGKSSTGR